MRLGTWVSQTKTHNPLRTNGHQFHRVRSVRDATDHRRNLVELPNSNGLNFVVLVRKEQPRRDGTGRRGGAAKLGSGCGEARSTAQRAPNLPAAWVRR